MLAPFVVNLLVSCLLFLLLGWALDVISGWVDSRRSGMQQWQRRKTDGTMAQAAPMPRP
jgi:hypothetical protein